MKTANLQGVALGLGLALGAATGLVAGNVTVGLGFGMALGAVSALLLDRDGSTRGPLRMVSAASIGVGGGILAGYLAGMITSATEFQTAVLMLGSGIVGAVLTLVLYRKRGNRDSVPDQEQS